MNSLYVIRESLLGVYYKNSKVFDKILQFVLALAVFILINQNIGFMKAASSPVVAAILAVICAFLPMIVTVIIATALVLVHMYAVSVGMLIVTTMIFLIMYIFYVRFAPKMGLVVLLTPLAFFLKIPYVVPIACGLIAGPSGLVAVSCGTIAYYMMSYVKKSAASVDESGFTAILSEVTTFCKQVFQNKEMWVFILAFIICCFVVYTIRRASFDHAWTIAIFSGTVANVVVIAACEVALGVHISMTELAIGSIVGVIVGLILELFLLSVDYSRCERIEYEDDEYYYYVKAVPKVQVSRKDKTVKTIESDDEDEKPVRRKIRKKKDAGSEMKHEDVDQELLKRSLEKDLDL